MNLVIYGAQGVALGLYNAIRILYPEKSVECFLVTSIDNNASTLGGLPVRELYQYIEGKSQREKDNIAVLIGTPESVMEDIEKSLNKVGLHNCVRVDSIKWGHLQELAFAKKSEFVPLNTFPVGCIWEYPQYHKLVRIYAENPARQLSHRMWSFLQRLR